MTCCDSRDVVLLGRFVRGPRHPRGNLWQLLRETRIKFLCRTPDTMVLSGYCRRGSTVFIERRSTMDRSVCVENTNEGVNSEYKYTILYNLHALSRVAKMRCGGDRDFAL
jgi:hypothetical protein